MHFVVSPILINHLERRVLELEAVDAVGMDRATRNTHNQRLRNARLALGRARGSHTEEEWQTLLAECNHDCVRCGRHHDEAHPPVKGHIVPFAMGGSDAIANIMPVCRQCASARGTEGIDWLAAYRETKAEHAAQGA